MTHGTTSIDIYAPPLLAVEGLTLELAAQTAGTAPASRHRVVDDVSFAIRPGERLGLVGASGSGKTLTALAIAGLLPDGIRQSAGAMTLGVERHVLDATERRITSARSDNDKGANASAARSPTSAARESLRTAMIFQDARAALQPIRRIGKQLDDVLRYAPRPPDATGSQRPWNRKQRHAAALALLEEVGLHDAERVLRAYPAQLSGGMCQRVMIALALARTPQLLLADEPTTGLDAANQERVMRLLDQAASTRRAALLLITHDLPLAVAHCDRIVVMRAGRCVEVIDAATIGNGARHRYTRTLWAAHRLAPFAVPGVTKGLPPSTSRDLAKRVSSAEAPAEHTLDRASSRGTVLQLEALSKGYAALLRRRTPVLRDVDLTVRSGEIIGIAGPSGGGKTTLGRIVSRLLRQDAGRVIWREEDLSGTYEGDAAKASWRHEIQYVHQDARGSLDPLRTVGEIVAAARWPAKPNRADTHAGDDVEARLREVGLPAALSHRRPHALSGGEAARVAFARALARKPHLLVLDEPTAALDALSRARILRLLHRLARAHGLAIICISHDLDALHALCDRVLQLEAGKLTVHR